MFKVFEKPIKFDAISNTILDGNDRPLIYSLFDEAVFNNNHDFVTLKENLIDFSLRDKDFFEKFKINCFDRLLQHIEEKEITQIIQLAPVVLILQDISKK